MNYNRMYCTHNTTSYDAWRKSRDEEKKKKQLTKVAAEPAKNETTESEEKQAATTKKLSLSDKLRIALITHAGLSNDAFARIWEETDRDLEN